jgi:hypothetical protein
MLSDQAVTATFTLPPAPPPSPPVNPPPPPPPPPPPLPVPPCPQGMAPAQFACAGMPPGAPPPSPSWGVPTAPSSAVPAHLVAVQVPANFYSYSVDIAMGCASSGGDCAGVALLLANFRAGVASADQNHVAPHGATIIGRVTFLIPAGQHRMVTLVLNATGRKMLARAGRLTATLSISLRQHGRSKTVARRTLTLHAPTKRAR